MLTRRDLVSFLAVAGAGAQPETIVIPFRVTRGTPWIGLSIAGSEPMPFALGTSNGVLIVDRLVADRFHPRELTAAAGLVQFRDIVVANQFRVEEHVGFVLDHYAGERPVVGSFGLNLFASWAIDWDRREVTLSRRPPSRSRPKAPTRVSTDIHRRGWPVARVEVDGRMLNLLIESDMPHGVLLKPDAPLLAWARRFSARRENVGPDGRPSGVTVRARSLRLGACEVAGPLITVGDYLQHGAIGGDQRRGDWRINCDGIMGFDFARRFNLACDSDSLVLRATPSAQIGDVQADDRAGLALEHLPSGYRVLQIDPAGPAARAGLERGDVIVEHHGPDGLIGLPFALTRAPGTRVPLTVDRAGADLELTIVLEERVAEAGLSPSG